MSVQTIDTADTVHHVPTDEIWTVAYVHGEKLAWLGWPPGEARLSDCVLIEKATPEARASILRLMAGSQRSEFASYARQELARATDPKDTP